jgi:nucleotide-binding universal stress UspA family protein
MAAAMTSIRTVVVGISGAPADDAVLAWAVEECQTTGGRLVIAHACSHGIADEERDVAGHPGLAAAIDRARRDLGDDRVGVRAQAPPSGAMLLGLVTSADLLVVGPPSRKHWMHWGSTTHYVTRHAPCPVIVARNGTPGSGSPFAGHVVVGVDGSTAGRAGVGFGFPYADSHGLPLVAVTVADDDARDIWYDDQLLEAHLTTEPAALSVLSAELEPWEHEYPHVWVKRAVFSGLPVDGLLRAAEGARLLVVGAHGGRPGRRLLLGSTSLDAISRATCSVAVLQPPPVALEQLPTPKEVHHVRT